MTDASELILSRRQIRELDRIAEDRFGVDTLVLMENAGRGCADLLLRQNIQGKVVICCGKGNNGGDGFVIARHLEIAGVDVEVVLLAAPHEVFDDAARNLRILALSGTAVRVMDLPRDAVEFTEVLSSAAWVVDALLGTGPSGPIREPYVEAIERINAAARPVLSVDLPSGFDCDAGIPLGTAVRAKLTATFVARKLGFQAPGAEAWTGQVEVVGIGVPLPAIAQACHIE